MKGFKMFKDKYGYLCAWDKIIPNYTIFHNDDHTFSDCWTDFSEDFNIFYQDILKDMTTAATKKENKENIVDCFNVCSNFCICLSRSCYEITDNH